MASLTDSVGLLFKIKADSSDAIRDLKLTKAELMNVGGAAETAGGGFSSLAGPAAIATAGALALGAAVASTAIGLFNLAKAASEYGSAINDAMDKTGLGAETLTSLKYAAETSGSSFEKVSAEISKFSILLGESKNGNEKAIATLKQYNITATDTQTALAQAVKVIAEMTDADKQAVAAKELFKDRTAEILPVIKSFNGDLPGLIAKLQKLGLTMTDEDARAADQFGDTLDTLSAQAKSVGYQFAFGFMPQLTNAMNAVSGSMSDSLNVAREWGREFGLLIRGIIKLSNDLYAYSQTVPGRFLYAIVGALPMGLNALGGFIKSQGGPPAQDNLIPDRNPLGGDPALMARSTPKSTKAEKTPSSGRKAFRNSSGDDWAKDQLRAQKEAEAEMERVERERVQNAKQYYQDETAFFEAEAKKRYAIAVEYAKVQKLTDDDLAKFKELLDAKTLQTRLDNLRKFQKETVAGSDEYKRAEQDIRILEMDVETMRAQHAKNQQDRDEKKREQQERDREYWRDEQAASDARIESISKEIDAIKAKQEAEAEARLQALRQDKLNRTVGSGSAIGAFGQLRDAAIGKQNTAAIAGLEALQTAFEGVGQAAGQAVAAFVLYGSAGASVRQVTAQILASVAQQAAVKAVFELAEGFAALALAFFGVPNAGPSATAHFTAAAIYGGIAGVAAIAGRAVAGDSFKQQTSAATSGGQTAGSRSTNGGSAYSSRPDGTATNSRNTPLAMPSLVITNRATGFSDMFKIEWAKNSSLRQTVLEGIG